MKCTYVFLVPRMYDLCMGDAFGEIMETSTELCPLKILEKKNHRKGGKCGRHGRISGSHFHFVRPEALKSENCNISPCLMVK